MSDATRAIRHIDPARLSAYYDGDIQASERRLIDAHLAGCAFCRHRLAEYSLLGTALQSDPPSEAPSALDVRVSAAMRGAARAMRRRSTPRSWMLRPAWGAAALAVLLLGIVFFAGPFRENAGAPRVASAHFYEDRGEVALAVRFTGPVDRDRVGQSVKFDPPVRVDVSWQGDTMVVKPAEPLRPDVSYTLNISPGGPTGDATPVAIPFATSVPSLPSPTATKGLPAAAPTATASATAMPTPSATPSPSPRATGAATPAPFQPVRGFGTLYRTQPTVAAALGNPLEPEHGLEMVIQPFQHGLLLWRGDRKEILALLESRRWRDYPDTFTEETMPPKPGEPVRGFGKLWREQSELRAALGMPTAPESAVGAVLQSFERGMMVWTEDRIIYVLYAGGTWERYADSYVEPVPTPSASSATMSTVATATATAANATTPSTSTPAPVASSTATAGSTVATTETPMPMAATTTPSSSGEEPTATAVATATPTPAGLGCPAVPVRGLGLVYRENPTVASSLGCALVGEASMQLVRQSFERGVMLWRADTREILVMLRDGTWSSYQDTWQESEGLGDPGQPPEGLIGPIRGFGKVWREHAEVREAIGWATSQETPVAGVIQQFARGRMLWTGDHFIYVLYPNGAYQGFVDTYVEPTPGPR